MGKLVTRTEQIIVERPLDAVLESQSRTTIEKAIAKTPSLPHVSGTYMLRGDKFGEVGSRRLTCLTDSSTVEEEVLEKDRTTVAGVHWRRVESRVFASLQPSDLRKVLGPESRGMRRDFRGLSRQPAPETSF
jgi:hypothetical protein